MAFWPLHLFAYESLYMSIVDVQDNLKCHNSSERACTIIDCALKSAVSPVMIMFRWRGGDLRLGSCAMTTMIMVVIFLTDTQSVFTVQVHFLKSETKFLTASPSSSSRIILPPLSRDFIISFLLLPWCLFCYSYSYGSSAFRDRWSR